MEADKTEEIIKERKEKLKKLFLKKSFLFYIVLALLVYVAWDIRTSNVPGLIDITTGQPTLGPDLDPFLFLRWAKYIVEHGRLMELDSMRYVPLGYDTSGETILLPYLIAYFHKVLNFFKPVSVDYSAVLFPVFMFVLTAIAFALMTRKIFEENEYKNVIALISTGFLIFSPSLLSRTIAGIPEKESAGFFFMFLSFYFLISALNSKNFKRKLILSSLAGITTALMGLVWGGWVYILTTVSVMFFIAFILGKIDKNEFYVLLLWLFFSVVVTQFFSQRYSIKGLLFSTSSGLAFAALLLSLIDILIFQTKFKENKIVKRLGEKYPQKVISLGIFLIIALLLSTTFLGISFIPDFFKGAISQLKQPYYDRLSFTVAENRQPYYTEWKGEFGPTSFSLFNQTYNIPPLFFWLFFFGSISLVYEAVKGLETKKKWIIVLSYIIFLFTLIFSRYSPSSMFNGENNISKFLYFGGILYFIGVFVYLFYFYSKEKNLDELKKIDFRYLLVIAFFIISIIGARSAIRLIMGLVPAASILAGYFVVATFIKAKNSKGDLEKIIVWVIAALIILSAFYALYFNYKIVSGTAPAFVPSIYTQQWQQAMAWVRVNTPENAVFAHWWDYGYWLQSIGNRPTVLDGGNVISYWNHLIARHVLTGHTEEGALNFLYTHNVSYLLIDSTDLGKYSAFSFIGSDVNYDRRSFIPTFVVEPRLTQETKDELMFIYTGGTIIEDDFTYNNNNSTQIFPVGQAGIGGVRLIMDKEGNIKNAQIIIVYKQQQYDVPLNCIYFNNKVYNLNENGYNGCLYIIPSIAQDSGRVNINQFGAGIFIGERVYKTLLTKFYLFNEKSDFFELVYSEDDFVVRDLKNQGAIPQNQDFVLFNGVRGPIKMWKVNYPEGIEIVPEYLETNYPDEIRNAETTF